MFAVVKCDYGGDALPFLFWAKGMAAILLTFSAKKEWQLSFFEIPSSITSVFFGEWRKRELPFPFFLVFSARVRNGLNIKRAEPVNVRVLAERL